MISGHFHPSRWGLQCSRIAYWISITAANARLKLRLACAFQTPLLAPQFFLLAPLLKGSITYQNSHYLRIMQTNIWAYVGHFTIKPQLSHTQVCCLYFPPSTPQKNTFTTGINILSALKPHCILLLCESSFNCTWVFGHLFSWILWHTGYNTLNCVCSRHYLMHTRTTPGPLLT